MRTVSAKLKAFGELIKPGRPDEVTVLELDAASLEIVENYIGNWLRNRILHNKQQKRNISEDAIYNAAVNYIVKLNSTLFHPRLWSEAGIRTEIWGPLDSDQNLLDFVYRGASELYVRVYGKASDTTNISFSMLAKHIADGLCVMSGRDGGLLDEHHLQVFPQYGALERLLISNPWVVFVYYLARMDLFTLISQGDN